jgi:hypothetical protein
MEQEAMRSPDGRITIEDALLIQENIRDARQEGSGWAVYNTLTPQIVAEEVLFFRSAREADQYCKDAWDLGEAFQYTSLHTVQQTLDKVLYGREPEKLDAQVVRAELEKNSVYLPYPEEQRKYMEDNLAKGQVYPVEVDRIILPAEQVQGYHVVAMITQEWELPGKTQQELVASYATYEQGREGLDKTVSTATGNEQQENYILIGQYAGRRLSFGEDLLNGNNGLVFSTAFLEPDRGQEKRGYLVDHLHTPDTPVALTQTVLAQIDQDTKRLSFYDGQMRPVQPEQTLVDVPVVNYEKEAGFQEYVKEATYEIGGAILPVEIEKSPQGQERIHVKDTSFYIWEQDGITYMRPFPAPEEIKQEEKSEESIGKEGKQEVAREPQFLKKDERPEELHATKKKSQDQGLSL